MDGRGFRFGDWQVDVGGNSLSHGDARATLEPRAMDVLRYLCRHPGAVIPAEELLQTCWGTAELGDNPVHKAIAQLRRALGDSSTEPRYIETVRKRGYRAIAAVVELEDQTGVWQGGSPFRGLEAFQESHAAIFFGRVQATHRLRETVLRQVADGCPMALVLGPSGSGKTSLVRAGLLPSLASDPVALSCVLHMDCADLAGGDLFGALAAVLVDAECDERRLFEGSSADALGQRLRDDPDAVAATLGAGTPIRIAIFVDRLEAIFRAPATTDADRARFVHVLEMLARAGTLVILACRNDFYPSLIALPELMALKSRGGHFDVEPPDGADIAQMVRQPARAAQLTFEHDAATGASLDDVLCDAARASPDALPLLQYCLDELYRQRGDDGTLRFDVFRQLGGIEGALGVRAEQIVAALPAAQQAALPHVLSLLVNIGEEQNAVTARRPAWSALTHEAQRELVRALVEARLFVSELTGDVPTFGVAHEALLRRWPRVVEWVERHRQSLQIRTRVAAQAERWAAAGRPRDLLLPAGMQTNQACGLLEIGDLTLSGQERDYVGASLRRAKLGARIRIGVMSVIALLAVLAAVLGLTARSAQKEAEQRRADAEGLMSFMLGDFVDKLRPLGRLELLDSISSKALAYLTSHESPEETRAAVLQRAKTLHLIAEVQVARRNTGAALNALQLADRIIKHELTVGPEDTQSLKAAGENAFWQGQISFNARDWKTAVVHFSRYLMFSEKQTKLNPEDIDSVIELSYAYNSLGSAKSRQGDISGAVEAFNRSLALKQQALARAPDRKSLIGDIANSISWLANARAGLGALEEALHLREREVSLLQKLHSDAPADALWTQRLASALARRGDINHVLGHATNARSDFDTAEEHFSLLVNRDRTNAQWRKQLLTVQLNRALSAPRAGGEEALSRAKELHRKIMAFSAESGSADSTQLVTAVTFNLARQLLDRDQIESSWQALSPALERAAVLTTKASDIWSLNALSEMKLIHSEILARQGQQQRSQKVCIEVLDTLDRSKEQSDYRLLSAYVRASYCALDHMRGSRQEAKLRKMAYREPRYLAFINKTGK